MKHDLIIDNLKLVDYVVRKYFGLNHRVEYDDLVQMGRLGLISAAERFDPNRGTPFATYAIPMIKGTIKRHLRDGDAMRISRNIRSISHKVYVMRIAMENELQRKVTYAELSEKCGIDEKIAQKADMIFQEVFSLEKPLVDNDGEGDIMLKDMISDGQDFTDNLCFEVDMKHILDTVLHNNNPSIAHMLDEYFTALAQDNAVTQKYLAQKYHMSQSYVSRLIKAYTQKMRKELICAGYYTGF